MQFDDFLRRTLPLLGYNWTRYRKACIRRRLSERMSSLGLRSWEEYALTIRESVEEQSRIRRLLCITISRFWRNDSIFRSLEDEVVPYLAKTVGGNGCLDIWSVGTASGQEALSIAMLVSHMETMISAMPRFRIVASDVDISALKRGSENRWTNSELRSIPTGIRNQFCLPIENGHISIDQKLYERVLFVLHDFFQEPPLQQAHIVLCRNSVLTYTSGYERERIMKTIISIIPHEGYLVLGRKERLPRKWAARMGLIPMGRRIYKRYSKG